MTDPAHSRARRAWAWAGALLLVFGASFTLARLESGATRPGATPSRAATPLSELARNVQWIRFQRALLRGDGSEAIEHAERAVALDPASTESWELLASHLAVYRGSPERELDLERRRRWFAAGVEAAKSGERSARDPARLLMWQGLLYADRARIDPDLLPGGARQLLEESLELFRRAGEHGVEDAHAMELFVRDELAELRAN